MAEGLTPNQKPSQIPLLRKSVNYESSRVLRKVSHSFSGRKPRGLNVGELDGADVDSRARRF